MAQTTTSPIGEELERREVPGHRMVSAWIARVLLILLVGSAILFAVAAVRDPASSQRLMDAEKGALAVMAGGEQSAGYHAMEGRARKWADLVKTGIPEVPQEKGTKANGVIDRFFIDTVGDTPQNWWNYRVVGNLRIFLPVLFVRLEIVLVVFAAFLPFLICAFFIGEGWAREKKRAGVRPGEHWFKGVGLLVKLGLFVMWVLPFVPLPIPVAYWLLFSLAATWGCMVFLRSHSIEF